MHHLSTELLQNLAGIQMTHVPYKATPPAMNDLIAGHIQVLFGDTTSTLPFIKQGTVRGARGHHRQAQPGGAGRSDRRRDGSGVRIGVLADAGRARRHAAGGDRAAQSQVHAIFSDPAVIDELERRGIGPALTGTPDEVREFVKQEIVRWSDVVRRAGLEGSQ